MKPANLFTFTYLAYLSQPKGERTLYRALRQRPVKSIVELGVGDGTRAARLLSVAQRFSPDTQLSYTGVDLFEGRPAGQPGISLKEAHKMFKATGAKTLLLPGDPFSALARAANRLSGSDLLVISNGHDPHVLEQAWYYVPRMLHETSRVFVEVGNPDGSPGAFEAMTPEAIRLRVRRPQRQAA